MTNQFTKPSACKLAMAMAFGLMVAPLAEAQHYKTLYTFTGAADGANPYGTLARDSAGNLYGTAVLGGANSAGVVYKLDTGGTLTVLNNFTPSVDGTAPVGGVIRDAAGNLYGTTLFNGGIPGGCCGWGTVYKLDPSGAETVLYVFNEFIGDAPYPFDGVIRDEAGNLYGTLSGGKVFKLTSTGMETIPYSFTGGTDGGSPYAGVIRDAEGNLYGNTAAGGNLGGCGGIGCGLVYKVNAAGRETVLHNFVGTDGAYPISGLLRDPAGNLYGATYQGGAYNLGTVFKLDTTGKLTVLHNFAGGTDGANPTAALIQGTGFFYGTTALGGANDACPSGCGTAFRMAHDGTVEILHRFTGGDGGAYPQGTLVFGGGNLYGATSAGGKFDAGVIFEITP